MNVALACTASAAGAAAANYVEVVSLHKVPLGVHHVVCFIGPWTSLPAVTHELRHKGCTASCDVHLPTPNHCSYPVCCCYPRMMRVR
jgi:hypothetical protein